MIFRTTENPDTNISEIKSAYKIWNESSAGVDFGDDFEKKLTEDGDALKEYIDDLNKGVDQVNAQKTRLANSSQYANMFVKSNFFSTITSRLKLMF